MLQDLIVGKQGRCVYCGWPSWGFTCSAHRDLLRLDPTFLV
jgi:hypothetical protein